MKRSLENNNNKKPRSQSKLLRHIHKLRETIRRKHQMLNAGKETLRIENMEKLAPIIGPLKQLVERNTSDYIKSEPENVKLELNAPRPGNAFEEEEEAEEEHNIISNDYDPPLTAATEDDDNENIILDDRGAVGEEKQRQIRGLKFFYDHIKNPAKLDNLYGIHQDENNDNLFLLRDTPLTFSENSVYMNDTEYDFTKGLSELLVKKQPNMKEVSPKDLENYKLMLMASGAYESSNRKKKSKKYTEIIAPMFAAKSTKLASNKRRERAGHGLVDITLPIHKQTLGVGGGRLDYVYWDDPNEIVDRLKLLIASHTSGNNSVSNEIIAILEELREADIIY